MASGFVCQPPRTSHNQASLDMNVYQKLLDEIRPHWKLALGSMGFSIAMAVFELLPSVLTQRLIDDALARKTCNCCMQSRPCCWGFCWRARLFTTRAWFAPASWRSSCFIRFAPVV
jgi:ABC-type multidrug transport system fused ATPase/permease subunit